MKRIYVGNLPWAATDDDVRDLFQQHGTVHSARVITDRETGRSRGFAFVEMGADEAETAISALNGTEMMGRPLRVSEAFERGSRRPSSW